MTQREIHHLLWRASFGPDPLYHKGQTNITRAAMVRNLFNQSKSYKAIPKVTTVIEDISSFKTMSALERKTLLEKSSKNILNIGLAWLEKMTSQEDQLRERMVLFWHDHFASSAKWDTLIYNQNETLRKHALGSFRDLLKAMCNDAMLLKYLDNQRNSKQHPNENFTRELLELFTLGEGNYTETDIREGARAFTGHAFNFQGEYLFKIGAHDYGIKTFMGKTGRFRAEEIIDIILEQKQTAKHIVRKIYAYFVNTNIDEAIVERLSNDFYNSDYDISKLMQQIFESDWFYHESNIGTKVKSPIDLIVGLMRQTKIEFKQTKILIAISKILGQIPFHPPNVAGWPIGKQWIDSSSLLFRMRLADFLFLGQKINAKAKVSLDMQSAMSNSAIQENNEVINFNFKPLRNLVENYTHEEQLEYLSQYLLQTGSIESNVELKNWISMNLGNIDHLIMNLFRLPEYQLC